MANKKISNDILADKDATLAKESKDGDSLATDRVTLDRLSVINQQFSIKHSVASDSLKRKQRKSIFHQASDGELFQILESNQTYNKKQPQTLSDSTTDADRSSPPASLAFDEMEATGENGPRQGHMSLWLKFFILFTVSLLSSTTYKLYPLLYGELLKSYTNHKIMWIILMPSVVYYSTIGMIALFIMPRLCAKSILVTGQLLSLLGFLLALLFNNNTNNERNFFLDIMTLGIPQGLAQSMTTVIVMKMIDLNFVKFKRITFLTMSIAPSIGLIMMELPILSNLHCSQTYFLTSSLIHALTLVTSAIMLFLIDHSDATTTTNNVDNQQQQQTALDQQTTTTKEALIKWQSVAIYSPASSAKQEIDLRSMPGFATLKGVVKKVKHYMKCFLKKIIPNLATLAQTFNPTNLVQHDPLGRELSTAGNKLNNSCPSSAATSVRQQQQQQQQASNQLGTYSTRSETLRSTDFERVRIELEQEFRMSSVASSPNTSPGPQSGSIAELSCRHNESMSSYKRREIRNRIMLRRAARSWQAANSAECATSVDTNNNNNNDTSASFNNCYHATGQLKRLEAIDGGESVLHYGRQTGDFISITLNNNDESIINNDVGDVDDLSCDTSATTITIKSLMTMAATLMKSYRFYLLCLVQLVSTISCLLLSLVSVMVLDSSSSKNLLLTTDLMTLWCLGQLIGLILFQCIVCRIEFISRLDLAGLLCLIMSYSFYVISAVELVESTVCLLTLAIVHYLINNLLFDLMIETNRYVLATTTASNTTEDDTVGLMVLDTNNHFEEASSINEQRRQMKLAASASCDLTGSNGKDVEEESKTGQSLQTCQEESITLPYSLTMLFTGFLLILIIELPAHVMHISTESPDVFESRNNHYTTSATANISSQTDYNSVNSVDWPDRLAIVSKYCPIVFVYSSLMLLLAALSCFSLSIVRFSKTTFGCLLVCLGYNLDDDDDDDDYDANSNDISICNSTDSILYGDVFNSPTTTTTTITTTAAAANRQNNNNNVH